MRTRRKDDRYEWFDTFEISFGPRNRPPWAFRPLRPHFMNCFMAGNWNITKLTHSNVLRADSRSTNGLFVSTRGIVGLIVNSWKHKKIYLLRAINLWAQNHRHKQIRNIFYFSFFQDYFDDLSPQPYDDPDVVRVRPSPSSPDSSCSCQNFRLKHLFYLSNTSIETISFHEFYEFIIYI